MYLHDTFVFSVQDIRPDGGMVWDVVLFLWNKLKVVIQGDGLQTPTFIYCIEKIEHFETVCT